MTNIRESLTTNIRAKGKSIRVALPFRSGLVAYWPMSEGRGITAQDVTGNYSGSITGAIWTTGPSSTNALHFDGAGDYVNAGYTAIADEIADTDKLTFVCMGSTSGTVDTFMLDSRDAGVASDKWLGITAGPVLKFHVRELGSDYTAPAFFDSTWRQYAATYDGTNIYVYHGDYTNRRVQNPTKANNPGVNLASNNQLWGLGARYGGTVGVFNGDLAEICIYDRALSKDEILILQGRRWE